MSTNRLLAAALVLTICLPSLAQAKGHKPEDRLQDPQDPSNEKTKPIADCLKKMIEVYRKIGAEEGPMQKAANETADALEGVLKDGRGYAETLDPGTSAAVDQSDTPEKTKYLIVDKSLKVFRDCDPCKPFFHLLLGTLVHEAVHLGWSLTLGVPANLEEKLKKLEQECPAYQKALVWKQELRNAAERLRNELLGVEGPKPPAWIRELFKDCKDPKGALFDLIKELNLDIGDNAGKVEALDDYLTKCLRDFKKIEEICKTADRTKWFDCLNKDERLKAFYHPVPFDGPEAAFTLNARAGVFLVDGEDFASRVPLPQDSVVFELGSASWLLVIGNMTDDGPGLARLHRLERQDGKVRSVEVRAVADPDGRMEFATGAARRADGRFFAFDFDNASIHELRDTDADGLPDLVGPSAATLPPADEARHFCHVSAVENDLVLRIRAIEPIFGNSPLLVLSDAGGDGFYESFEKIHPSQFPSNPPCWLGTLVEGMTEVGVAGAQGHQFAVVSVQNPNQPLAQGQFPAFPDRIVFVQLARPLQAGEKLRIRDLTNGQSTPSGTVEARRPVLHLAIPARIRPREEVEVILRGAGLEGVAGVRIGGKKVDIVAAGPAELRVRTHSLKRAERYEIEFELQDKSRRAAELSLFPDLSDE
jgi:hypothetical protein